MVVATYHQHNRSSNLRQAFRSLNFMSWKLVEEKSPKMEISSSSGLLFFIFLSLFCNLFLSCWSLKVCLLSVDDEKIESLSCHLARLLQNCTLSVHFSEVINHVLISWDQCPFIFSVGWKCERRRSC
jgi:hypothetical protein